MNRSCIAAAMLKLLLAAALVLGGPVPGAAAAAAENGIWAEASVAGGTHLGQDEFGPEVASGATLAAKGAGNLVGKSYGRLGTVVQNPGLTIKGFHGSQGANPYHALDRVKSVFVCKNSSPVDGI